MVVQMRGGAAKDNHQIALALVAKLMGESRSNEENIAGLDGFGLPPFNRIMFPSAHKA